MIPDDQYRLSKGLKEGDRKIFEEIYRLYFSPLCYYCLRYVGDMEEAKEIVQGLFLKIWIKRKEIDINASLKSYLYSSVQNYALNFIQQQKIKQQYVNDRERFSVQQNENGQHKLEEKELTILIKNAILHLPRKRREIFELSRFENLKYNQIAEHLTISVKTVEIQMSKSLSYLRQVLKDYLPVLPWLLLWISTLIM